MRSRDPDLSSGFICIIQVYIPWKQTDQDKSCPGDEYPGSYDHHADLFPDITVSYQRKDPADHPLYFYPCAVHNDLSAELLLSLSRSYEEAAAIDGCTPAKTFWQIMLPLVQPALVTVTIFNFLSVWNEFFMALIFATSTEMTPVGVGLLQIVNGMKYTSDYGGLFAAVIIVFLPTFLLYIFLSEKIIAGVTGGGVKG